MPSPRTLRVEVAYAHPDRQCLVTVHVPTGTLARDAVRLSGLLQKFPELDPTNWKLGVSGRPVKPEQVLREGDRVEVYRPLRIDPKQARRRRARERS